MTDELDDKAKEWVMNIADKEFVRVYVNIAAGSLEMNCPAGRVETEGKIMYGRAMEFVKEYHKLYGGIEEEGESLDDNKDVA